MNPDPSTQSTLNGILIFSIAVLNAYTAWATLRARSVILQLEKNTNSMKDALVAMTAKSSFREGNDAGLAQAAAAAATVEPVKVDIVKMPPGGKLP